MNTVDIILAICFLPAIIQGFSKGFVAQAVAIISLILGVWASFHFMELVCGFITPYLHVSESIIHVISFILIFCAVGLLLGLVEKIVTKVLKIAMMGWLNKLLGMVFAAIKAFLLVGVVIMLFNTVNTQAHLVSQEVLDNSVLYGPIKDAAYAVFPYFKDLLFNK